MHLCSRHLQTLLCLEQAERLDYHFEVNKVLCGQTAVIVFLFAILFVMLRNDLSDEGKRLCLRSSSLSHLFIYFYQVNLTFVRIN